MLDKPALPYQSPASVAGAFRPAGSAIEDIEACHHRRVATTVVSLVSAACFIVACILPTVYFDEGTKSQGTSACTAFAFEFQLGSPRGFEALYMGWFPPFTLPWSANWFGLAALVQLCRGKSVSARWCSFIASLLAATTLIFVFITIIPYPRSGYYFWQGSFAILWIGSLIQARNFGT